ncbi:MAG: Fe-S protein assembly co-chaperone HscB [Candidatus Marinimicrobia bacterium]|nr:Fe-S protein assembly co-chaperone HscB [Candidatus Neomarinimicrobiota bacterium]MBL7022823.1 Fe-S protein assembly co-chaperone HscB [Candidatus Neomarinimicrobiota bacterium]MBL7109456.1 Fe-S protein assembly co-chaperone HscB [Candidatus Neomarinimicrobiota bacterium]
MNSKSCWKCKSLIEEFRHFCAECDTIQPPSEENFYKFMRFEKKLGICTATLQNRYYELSRKFHPDYYQNKSSQELTFALKYSSILNRAYFTLKNPIARVRYLMMLEGIHENRDSGSIPVKFAEDIFEIQDCLMEYKSNPESHCEDELQNHHQKLKLDIDEIDQHIHKYFQNYDASENDKEKLDVLNNISLLLTDRNYLDKMKTELDGVL